MAHEKSKGWIGSLALHGLLATGVLVFAGLSPHEKPKEESVSLVINLNGDGSPAPGSGGGKALIPKGTLDGDPATQAPKEDPAPDDKQLQEEKRREAEAAEARRKEEERRKAEEERRREEAVKPPPPDPVPPKPAKPIVDPKPPKPKPPAKPENPPEKVKTMSYEEYLAQQAKANTTKPPKPPQANTKNGGEKAGPPTIKSNTGNLDRYGSKTSGKGALGVAEGTGPGGTPGGGGPVLASYEQRLKLLIQARWQALVDAEGNTLGGVSGEFRISISNNGNLRFAGWVNNPGNALFERLLLRAIDQVRNAGPRPPGMTSELIYEIEARPQ